MSELEWIEGLLRALAPQVRRLHAQRAALRMERKEDALDLVTEADLHVQARIAEALQRHFPGDRVVAEEGPGAGTGGDPAARCWLVDPIDGTHNFARALLPAYAVSVAFAQENRVEAAGLALPGLECLLLAARGRGATRNGRPIAVSTVDRIDEARVEVELMRRSRRPIAVHHFATLLEQAGQVRCHGSTAVSLAEVAAGGAEAFVHARPQSWDYAAGALLVEEAGGRVSRLDGGLLGAFEEAPTLVASNGRVHEQVLELVSAAARNRPA